MHRLTDQETIATIKGATVCEYPVQARRLIAVKPERVKLRWLLPAWIGAILFGWWLGRILAILTAPFINAVLP